MAFDQKSLPADLRPLNIVRTVPEDPRIVPATTSGRPIEGNCTSHAFDAGNPNSIPAMYYPVPMPEGGFVGMGYTVNVAMPMGNPVPVPATVSGGANWVPRVPPPQNPGVVATPVLSSASVTSQNPCVAPCLVSNASDHASEEGEDSVSGRKVKLLCSFGGGVMPRPSDGALRYVGGQTRIVNVRRDVSFGELVQKMVDIYGQNVAIKYQLPEEDLDALVSVSCPDDLENMMDEYEKLLERSADGSAKLRVFLFPPSDVGSVGFHIGDWHDSGQKYVDAVNGFGDGPGRVGITRKESTASAASTQGSDVNGTEVVDSLARAQPEVTGPISAGVTSSPGANPTSYQEAATVIPSVSTSHAIPVDTSAASVGVPVGNSGHPPSSVAIDSVATPMSFTMGNSGRSPLAAIVDSFDAPSRTPVGNYGHPLSSTWADNEVDKSAPTTAQHQQVGYEMQQPVTTLPAASPYLQGYIDLRHENLPRAEYVQRPSQIGFPGQLFGTVAPMYTQQHMATGNLQQFIPAGHMSMVPSSHVSMNPNLVQPFMQPQQIRLEHYPVENSVMQRIVHFPNEQGYNVYRAQVPTTGLSGSYGWHRAPQTEHMAFSEGFTPHQQAIAPEQVLKLDDCFMCQKALPHAHSDSVAQDTRESTAVEPQATYHTLHLDNKGRPIDSVLTTAAVGEGTTESPQTISQTQVLGHVNHENGNAQSKGLAKSAQGKYEKESVILQKAENSDPSRIPVPDGFVEISGVLQPNYGAFAGTVPQSFHEVVTHPSANPTQSQSNHEVTMSKPSFGVTSGLGGFGVTSGLGGGVLKTSDCLVDESPKDYSGNIPTSAVVEDSTKSHAAYDHLKQIDGRMENLCVKPSEVSALSEQIKPPSDNRQATNGESYPDSVFNRTKTVNNANPLSSNEAGPGYSNQYLFPVQAYEMSQPLVDSGLLAHSKLGVGLVPDETSCNSTVPNVDSALPTERNPPIGEWKHNVARYQPNGIASGAESVSSGGNVSPVAASYVMGDLPDNSNSLFSNQDFWSLQHETHFPPPKPSKIQIRKENASSKDPSSDYRHENHGDLLVENNMGTVTDQPSGQGNGQPTGYSEEQIKQQLQAVAEGVATSVLLSSVPSNTDLSALGKSDSSSMSQQKVEVQTVDQNKDRTDDIRARLPEKMNIGFPMSDSLGRLQIIKNTDLEELRELGSGTFGTVYHGKWRGTDVAIKRINDRCFAGKPSEQEKMRDDFWNEAIKLADLHHPNVVAFYGVVLDGPGGSIATVTEYMTNGSLRSALQKSERNLDKRKRLLVSMDVAFGMEYLHGKNIVHFDLKSDNLLVNLRDPHRPICKVGDLGLSKVKCQTLISGGVRGTLPWMAPELLNGSSSLVSEKVDVYSFGIVMWELLTGEEPYADLHYGAIIGGIVSNTLRPSVPEGCDPQWRSLMELCWSAEPSERPSFTMIANELRSMASKIPPIGQNQQTTSKQPPVKG